MDDRAAQRVPSLFVLIAAIVVGNMITVCIVAGAAYAGWEAHKRSAAETQAREQRERDRWNLVLWGPDRTPRTADDPPTRTFEEEMDEMNRLRKEQGD